MLLEIFKKKKTKQVEKNRLPMDGANSSWVSKENIVP